MTRLSMSAHIASRLASSSSVTAAVEHLLSTSGIRTLVLDEPPVSRMTRLSMICDRKPKPSFQSAPQPLVHRPRLFFTTNGGLPPYWEK